MGVSRGFFSLVEMPPVSFVWTLRFCSSKFRFGGFGVCEIQCLDLGFENLADSCQQLFEHANPVQKAHIILDPNIFWSLL